MSSLTARLTHAALTLSGAAALTLSVVAASPAERPNVILILADDLGWTDLGSFGSDYYQTPALDQLAKDGMRFTQAYSACTVCSPTRGAVMTGLYPARTRVTDWIPGRLPANPKLKVPEWTKSLPLETTTLAERFKAAGYVTANIGKWHLGQEASYPEKHGFDINIAGTREGAPQDGYFVPYKIPTLPDGPAGEYLTDRIGAEAVKFVEQHRDQPFFLYLPHFAVHTPIQAPKDLVDKYKALPAGKNHTNATYAAMTESMDRSIGLLRAKLKELNLDRNTIIVFGSDNGGHLPTTSNAPLRVGKGSAYEGGTRVPLIIYWPGVTSAGAVSEVPTISNDFYPTLLAAAGLPAPDSAKGEAVDGVNLAPVLSGKGSVSREALYWHYPHYQLYQKGGTTPYGAVRAGDYKLIEFYDDMRVELYNLREDIGETKNLATTQPELADKLRAQLHAWRDSVKAQMNQPNPAYDPAKPEHVPGKRRERESFQ